MSNMRRKMDFTAGISFAGFYRTIIISPYGCSGAAKRVISGAMREHGKLILSLTTTELADVLMGMDQGSDPNAYLFDRVDEFLIGLGR